MKHGTILGAVGILAIAAITIVVVMQPEPTAEQLQAEAAYEQAKSQASIAEAEAEAQRRAEEQSRRHQEYLEREAAKPIEQKVAESQTDVGEAVVTTAVIGAGTFILLKMLDF
jgi:F0F1-type ATP synthase membrane subunit b/b'